jgi:PST family polysaccharide transporter
LAILIAAATNVAFLLGIGYGPAGVALSFSTAMAALVIPVIVWARRGTLITPRDVAQTLVCPLAALIIAAVVALACWQWIVKIEPPLLRVTAANTVLFSIYLGVLLFAFNHKHVYVQLLRETGLLTLRKVRHRGNDG